MVRWTPSSSAACLTSALRGTASALMTFSLTSGILAARVDFAKTVQNPSFVIASWSGWETLGLSRNCIGPRVKHKPTGDGHAISVLHLKAGAVSAISWEIAAIAVSPAHPLTSRLPTGYWPVGYRLVRGCAGLTSIAANSQEMALTAPALRCNTEMAWPSPVGLCLTRGPIQFLSDRRAVCVRSGLRGTENSNTYSHDMNLKGFNQTIQRYQTLRNQLSAYHTLR